MRVSVVDEVASGDFASTAKGFLFSRLGQSLVVLWFPALLVRTCLSLSSGGSFHLAAYVRGTALDLLVVILLALPISRLPTLLYLLFLMVCQVLLTCLYYGNYEHVVANGDAIIPRDLYFMLSPEFREGSGTTISNPLLFCSMLFAPIGIYFFSRRRVQPRSLDPKTLLSLVILPAVVAFLIPDNLNRRVWEQSNVAALVAHDVLFSFFPPTRVPGEKPKDYLIEQYSKPNTVGRTIARAEPEDRYNVLLVLLEGISGTDVYRDYSTFLSKKPRIMPKYREVAKRGLSYPHTISLQRKTNRGMWSILCGQLPNLSSVFPKMDYAKRLQEELNFKCLPHHLNDAGYRSVYLQAADLNIMRKNQRLPELGFQEVYGEEWFKEPYFNTGWGPSDNHFFEQALRMVSKLQSEKKPWFLTLLTAGTHHPYKVPSEFVDTRFDHRERAVRVADYAIGAFVEGLASRGVLEDTLVIITSDESFGAGRTMPKIYENWVPLVVLEPSGRVKEILSTFSLNEIHLSVLDYLALESVDRPPAGRSIFREYSEPRSLVFGNAYARRVYQFTEDKQLVQCVSDFSSCEVKSYDDATFLWDEPEGGTPLSSEATSELRALVDWNDWGRYRLRILNEQAGLRKRKKIAPEKSDSYGSREEE